MSGRYDCIVVGGGTAGAIVAARLSEDSRRQVLLLEAGAALLDEPMPAPISTAGFPVLEGFNWDYEARSRGTGLGSAVKFPYPMAKVLGGGSSINGSVAMSARREDYDRWAAMGNPEWSWQNMGPWLAKSAAGRQGAAGAGATSGSGALLRGFFAACTDRGFPTIDVADSSEAGVGRVPSNACDGRRLSTASYLRDARHRSNLTILGGCEVTRLIVDEGAGNARVSGVEFRTNRGAERTLAANVVLCAGAIGSPVILMRTGIGPARDLERNGVAVRLDLPGIGRNLQDHPVVALWAVQTSDDAGTHEPVHQGLLQVRTELSPVPCDLQLFLLAGVSREQLSSLGTLIGEKSAAAISVVLATPSSAGRVELQGPAELLGPHIVLDFLESDVDLLRAKSGVRMAWEIMQGMRRDGLIGQPVSCNSRVVESDRMLEQMIRIIVRGSWHPVGTLRMGPAGDAMAVASERGLVHGCENLYVADAALMPAIPSVPTNLTCMLIGERIAAHLRECI